VDEGSSLSVFAVVVALALVLVVVLLAVVVAIAPSWATREKEVFRTFVRPNFVRMCVVRCAFVLPPSKITTLKFWQLHATAAPVGRSNLQLLMRRRVYVNCTYSLRFLLSKNE